MGLTRSCQLLGDPLWPNHYSQTAKLGQMFLNLKVNFGSTLIDRWCFLKMYIVWLFFVKTVSHWRLLKFSSHPVALSFQAYGPIFEPRVRVQVLLAVKSTLLNEVGDNGP